MKRPHAAPSACCPPEEALSGFGRPGATEDKLLALLREGSAAAAWEALGQGGDLAPEVAAQVPGLRCVGTAYTVRTRAGHGAAVVRAVDEAPAGSVLVIEVEGGGNACAWGGTATAVARHRGLAGVVTNGRLRDLAEIRALRFPAHAVGATARGWVQGGQGDVGMPVTVGGRTIRPGDLIIADDDGVVVVPAGEAGAAYARLERRLRFEREAAAIVSRGGGYADVIAAKPAPPEEAPA